MAAALALDVHGLRVSVSGWDEVVDDLRRDFSWFTASGEGPVGLVVEVERRPPAFDAYGPLEASFVTPRNVVYQDDGTTIVDYFGRALLALDRRRNRATVQGEDFALAREAAQNLVMSRVGEHLNRRGFVRLHALGLAAASGGVAVTMPSGSGKSTLALRALADERVRLLSEDSPLLRRDGTISPFPLRIGVNPTDRDLIPEGLPVRTLERIEFHPKLAVDVEHFADRIHRERLPLVHLVVGRRTLAERGALEPLDRTDGIAPLLREAVVGIGVYQGMEFVLQHGWRDTVGKSGILGRRAIVAASVLRRARVWRLLLGRDRESNWEALLPLLT
jgi:hypothetical protein